MDEQVETKEQVKLESKVSKRFLEVFSKRADNIQQRYAEHPDDFKLESDEQIVLSRINAGGLVEGVLAGVVSLVALRRLRTYFLRRMYARHQQANSESPMQQMIQQQQQQARQQQYSNNPFHNNKNTSSPGSEPPPDPGFFLNTMGWFLDLGFSFVLGSSFSYYRFDMDSIMSDLGKIPLGPGESTVSREFCPDSIKLLNKLRAEAIKGDKRISNLLESPKTKNVEALLQFAKNCELRTRFEEKIREEKGVRPGYRVSIPPPGVPVESMEGEESAFASDWVEDDSSSFGLESNNGESDTWASELVQDQEESGRRSN